MIFAGACEQKREPTALKDTIYDLQRLVDKIHKTGGTVVDRESRLAGYERVLAALKASSDDHIRVPLPMHAQLFEDSHDPDGRVFAIVWLESGTEAKGLHFERNGTSCDILEMPRVTINEDKVLWRERAYKIRVQDGPAVDGVFREELDKSHTFPLSKDLLHEGLSIAIIYGDLNKRTEGIRVDSFVGRKATSSPAKATTRPSG